MPIAFHQNIPGGWLALWRIAESEETLRRLVTCDDVGASCGRMRSPRRRQEALAWRALVRELLPEAGEIRYDAVGAPLIARGHIGVSHCRGWAAVIFRADGPCAVDIEPADRDAGRAARRYGFQDGIAGWCRHEALYKFSGRAARVELLFEQGLCIAYICEEFGKNSIFVG